MLTNSSTRVSPSFRITPHAAPAPRAAPRPRSGVLQVAEGAQSARVAPIGRREARHGRPDPRRPEGAGARRSASHSVTGLGLSLCPLAMVVGARRPGAPDGYALAQTPSQPSRPVGMGGAGARQRAGPAAPSPSSRLVAASHPKRRRREASCHTVKTQCVRGPCTPWAARRLAVRNAVPVWPRDRSRGACASARPRGAAATTTSPCSGSPSVRAAR